MKLSRILGAGFLVFLLLSACKQEEKIQEYDLESGILVKITQPAGEFSNDIAIDFLPPPFNLGEFQNNKYQFIVLSERVKRGKSIRVKPIASVELIDTNYIQNYIVAIPTDSTKQIIGVENFGMLATNYPAVMNMIDYWLKAQDHNPFIRTKWSSEQISLDLMK